MGNWWAVGSDVLPVGGAMVQAKDRRAAKAIARRIMVDGFRGGDFTQRDILRKVVELPRWIEAGPFTDQEAYEYEVGWAWADRFCWLERRTSGNTSYPAFPMTRAESVARQGEAETARIEEQVAARYGSHVRLRVECDG